MSISTYPENLRSMWVFWKLVYVHTHTHTHTHTHIQTHNWVHHQLSGHEFEQAPGVGHGQGSLACCSPRGRQESDMTERLN